MPTGMTMTRLRFLAVLPLLILLGGCNAVVLNPSGDVAMQQRDLLLESVGLMLVIIVPVLILIVAGLVLARVLATTKAQSAARADIAGRTPTSPTSLTGRADPMPGTRSPADSDRP